MRDWLTRLRAALSLRMLALLVAAILLLCGGMLKGESRDAQTQLEERISRTLSQVAGAGKVQVVIQSQAIAQKQGGIYETAQERPSGAVAVAQGADDPLVRLELQEALCTLLGLPASAVSIVAGGE